MLKIKTFYGDLKVQEKINEFLQELSEREYPVIDIKQSIDTTRDLRIFMLYTVIYKVQ